MFSRREPFFRASVRLGVMFVVLSAAIFALFSATLYLSFAHDLNKSLREEEATDLPEADAARDRTEHQSQAVLRRQIFLLDGAALVLLAGLGYWYTRRTLKPLRETHEGQKRFVANASHELRTPLAIMKGDFELAMRKPDERAPAAVQSGLEEVERMSGIVDDLLTLSRIDAHQERLEFAPTDLSELAREAAAKMSSYAELHEATLATSAASPVTVSADAAALQRAIFNLIKNAVEHGGAGSTVDVGVEREDGRARLVVADSGKGMSAAEQAHLFDRFYRPGQNGSSPGGLGMPIAKWVVEHHHGKIAVTSGSGRGTEVRVTLPAI